MLVGVLCAAAWWDIRDRRVPNQLTVAGLVAALLLRAPLGVDAVVTGLAGFAVALGVAVLFHALGAVGGGDAKLLGMVGAFLGLGPLPGALAYIVLLGAGMALVAMARRGLLLLLFFNTVDLFRSKRLVARSGSVRTLETPGAQTIPYAVPIAAGTLMWWFGQGVKL
ncbi:MAG: A24 family peptidase [Gemmatimonadales bacterium]